MFYFLFLRNEVSLTSESMQIIFFIRKCYNKEDERDYIF